MRFPFSRSPDDPDRTLESGTGFGLSARLAEGAKGGLAATLAMTAYRLPVSRSLPPTAEFWAKYVAGGDPEDHSVPALVLHLAYGVAGGVGFGLLAPAGGRGTDDCWGIEGYGEIEDHRETARLEAVGLLAGAAYGLALSVVGDRVVLARLLDEHLAADERLVFHVGHLVYGLCLGTWFGSRTGDRR